MLNLTMFYDNNSFKKSVQHGMDIVNNTNFKKHEHERMQAISSFKIGNIIEDNNNNGMLAIITSIEKDNIIAIPLTWYNKNGKIKKQYKNHGGYFFNPCHVTIVK